MKPGIVDVNVTLGQWPFRHVPYGNASDLAGNLKSLGIVEAWAGTFDGLLHKDIASANARLAEDCARHGKGILRPIGSINLSLPNWDDDIYRCAENHGMHGIRLHPNYHGYKLDDARVAACFELAASSNLVVQIAVTMEDERMMHPLMQVPPVDVLPLIPLLPKQPKLSVILINALRTVRGQPLTQLTSSGALYFDHAMVEGVAGVANVLKDLPLERLLFGSHAPLFYAESAILKLMESELSEEQQTAITHRNVVKQFAAEH